MIHLMIGVDTNNRLYLAVKWLWLLMQALILPLAALHAAALPAANWPLLVPLPWLALLGTAFLVLWLIAQSLLVMARFPLTLGGALLLVGGTVAQFVFLAISGGSLAGAAYSVFFATLAALALVALMLTAVALRRRTGSLPARLLALLGQLPAAALVWFMLAPLRPAFSGLGLRREWLEWLVLVSNVGLIVFNLSRFLIFTPQAQDGDAYDREWERWAAPTIIVLILSAAAAAVLAGIG